MRQVQQRMSLIIMTMKTPDNPQPPEESSTLAPSAQFQVCKGWIDRGCLPEQVFNIDRTGLF